MSITDELREFMTGADGYELWCLRHKKELTAIADRIDAEHERRLAETASGWDHWESTHVELPKDADGEPVHIGDELDGYGCPNGGAYCRAIVSKTMILVGTKDSRHTAWVMWDVKGVRHHHKPTVEDVLREFGDWYAHTKGGCDEDGIIAEYAAKLQLRGDGGGF